MPLCFRGHHVTAKEYRLAHELMRAGEGADQIEAILAMTPEGWQAWAGGHFPTHDLAGNAVGLGAPDDSWGGPYAAAVYRSQEAIIAAADKKAIETLAVWMMKMLADEGYEIRRKRKPRPPLKRRRRRA